MSTERVTTLVGGVSELYQSDLDVGRRVVERLHDEELGPGVLVEDLHYGAVAVAQRLEDLRPDCLVLVGAVERGRTPGQIERRRVVPDRRTGPEFQAAVGDAVTGYVSVDLIVEVATGLGALPRRAITVEVEPTLTSPSDQLSPEVAAASDGLLDAVKREVARAPVYVVVAELADRLVDGHLEPSSATDVLRALVAELERADETGAWGSTFRLRRELVAELGAGRTSVGMDHADWGLVWALVEELARLEEREARELLDRDVGGPSDPDV